MKILCTLLLLGCCLQGLLAQPLQDTLALIPQEGKDLTAATILKIENPGKAINTRLPELRPTISADGNLLFFIRQNDPFNTKFHSVPNSQDIWFSKKDSSGKWSKAVHLGAPLNTVEYNAVFWIAPANNQILIRNAFIDGDYVGNGVSLCQLTSYGNWSKPQMLIIKNYGNYDRGRQYGASMSGDGKRLFLYMSQEAGSPNNDIYICFPEKDGSWTEPKSIGKKINLKDYNEMTPYLAADGKTLYFSSNRPGGLGDNDIWKTMRLDSTWQNWSDPVNLGSPINTVNWDAFFTLEAGGQYAYLTSSLDSHGQSDIVTVKLLEREKPATVIVVNGNVYNAKTRKPLSASLVYQTIPDGVIAGNGHTDSSNGAFTVILPLHQHYSIQASSDHFFETSEDLNLDSLTRAGNKEIHKDLYLKPIEVGQVIRLNNVFFDFDKWNLRTESFTEINKVVKFLKENPTVEIEMSAHTDSRGSNSYNDALSENRAKSVMDYIISKGIPKTRITSHGYGETRPVATNQTDEGRQLNRRVEFTILKN